MLPNSKRQYRSQGLTCGICNIIDSHRTEVTGFSTYPL